MEVQFYIALASIFVIGTILGGMIAFLSRRVIINRQLRIAERKAAKLPVTTKPTFNA